ncbi:MAG: ATP-binding cassette domain-containing protein, partial [Oscillospiraceae bacterium]
EFIRAMPQGYDTVLEEDGTHLSGGEQQRISIARAILKNAPVIILDEATAYADAENEAKIQDAFSALTRGKTVLVIAHRLSTITGADTILVVENGCLKEEGKHNELIQKQGLYSRLYGAYSKSQAWALKRETEEVQA